MFELGGLNSFRSTIHQNVSESLERAEPILQKPEARLNELQTLIKDHPELKKLLEAKRGSIEILFIKYLSQKYHVSTTDISKMIENLQVLPGQINVLTSQLNTLSSQITGVQTQLDANSIQLGEVDNQIISSAQQTLEPVIAFLPEQLQIIQDELAKKRAVLNDLEAQYNDTHDPQIQDQIDLVQLDITVLNESSNRLTEALSTANDFLQNVQTQSFDQLTDLQVVVIGRTISIQNEIIGIGIDNKREVLSHLELQYNDTQDPNLLPQIQAAQQELDKLISYSNLIAFPDLSSQIANIRSVISDLETQYNDTSDPNLLPQIQAAQQELNRLLQMQENPSTILGDQLFSLISFLQERSELNEQSSSLESQLVGLTNTQSSLQTQITNLNTQLSGAIQFADRLKPIDEKILEKLFNVDLPS